MAANLWIHGTAEIVRSCSISQASFLLQYVFIYADLKKRMINIIGLCSACHFLGRVHLIPPCRKATYLKHYSECGHMKRS